MINNTTYSINQNDYSTYADDLSGAKAENSGYTIWTYTYTEYDNTVTVHDIIDDKVLSIALTNPFVYNNKIYNTIFINSNGTVGFNVNTNNAFYKYPDELKPQRLTAIFLPWTDFIGKIYYKEDTDNKTFTIIYDGKFYWNEDKLYQVKLILYLDGSGKADINFGEMGSCDQNSLFGFSFGSFSSADLKNTIEGSFGPPNSPVINVTNNQVELSNKKYTITRGTSEIEPTPYNPITPTLSNFSIPAQIVTKPFEISPPTSDSPATFIYRIYDYYTIENPSETFLNYTDSYTITATQDANDIYGTASISTTVEAKQTTRSNPTVINNSGGIYSFGSFDNYMYSTDSIYGNITNSVQTQWNLSSSSKKVLFTTSDKVTLTKYIPPV
jgi:hypothetical protein